MSAYHQIAVQLDHGAFEILKQHSKATRKPYAAIIAEALALLATSASDSTSEPLATASQPLVYATLGLDDQSLWKKRIRELRASGKSYAGISKMLFQEFQLSGQDGLPLSPSTIRSICSL